MARGALHVRRKPPETIRVEEEGKLAALTDLGLKLRKYGEPDLMTAVEHARLAHPSGTSEPGGRPARR